VADRDRTLPPDSPMARKRRRKPPRSFWSTPLAGVLIGGLISAVPQMWASWNSGRVQLELAEQTAARDSEEHRKAVAIEYARQCGDLMKIASGPMAALTPEEFNARSDQVMAKLAEVSATELRLGIEFQHWNETDMELPSGLMLRVFSPDQLELGRLGWKLFLGVVVKQCALRIERLTVRFGGPHLSEKIRRLLPPDPSPTPPNPDVDGTAQQ
jgi:hypothetical protein